MPGIYIETFGCQMNEADSQYIADRASASGYDVVSDPAEANVVVLNTCTVRDNAERRAYGRMAHMRALKKRDPGVKLIVCGCLAEQDRDRFHQTAPYLDGVFGTSELARLGDALAAWRPDFPESTDEAGLERALLEPLGGSADCIVDAFSHLRAFVTVQRGCSYYCTFCIVPHVRGRFDHRPANDIVAEVDRALAAGAREITLVGQTVNAWKDVASGDDFADLLAAIAARPGLERLSFLTSHPKDFTEKLARTMGALPQLNPRMHLPVQSGSNPLLRKMNRKYTVEQYLEKVAWLETYCPGFALSTDVIVGFPGESEEDFALTLDLCARVEFSQAFMFVYSPRRGTPAALWEQLPEAVGSERLKRLSDVVNAGMRRRHDAMLETTVRALIVGPSRRDRTKLAAKTTENVTIIAPRGDLSDAELVARPWLDVRVDAAHVWGCTGTLRGTSARYDGEAVPHAARETIDLITVR